MRISLRILVRWQSFCPFSLSTDHETTFAFGINKKYFLRKKCERKTFYVPKTIGQISKIYFDRFFVSLLLWFNQHFLCLLWKTYFFFELFVLKLFELCNRLINDNITSKNDYLFINLRNDDNYEQFTKKYNTSTANVSEKLGT